ncbi:MAG TPA: ATP-binding protein [Streptosporangiaceae bacterium]|jgi:ATPase family associated with various cellular activities (AAA)|nr:ATP-binding protein [Streptosporangiaceae bacterium]
MPIFGSGRPRSYAVLSHAGVALPEPPDTLDGAPPELADVGRLARWMVSRAVQTARADEAPVYRLLRAHLGPGVRDRPVASRSWPRYDQVNLQCGLEAWLAADGREHQLTGLTRYRHRDFTLADLLQPLSDASGIGVGSVQLTTQAAGPGGQVRGCVQCGVYLVSDGDERLALLLRGPADPGSFGSTQVTLEVCATDGAAAQRALEEIARLTIEHNVYRGHVLTFSSEVFGYEEGALLTFQDRPQLDRSRVILPPAVLDGIERHVLGVARHATRLAASGQHLRRGLLLYGAPGTGKTHTIRYLLGQLPGSTVITVSGPALGKIGDACSVARTLEPALIVVEDVDLIAEDRESLHSQGPLLFQLLNEMDGLGSDADVTFLLTTNRADLLEEALAARPGRVDHAVELPVPDAEARRRLIELYQGRLVLDLADPDAPVRRTEGVTASFLKELLRRAALSAADRDGPQPDGAAADGPLRVTDADMTAALDQLLDTRNQLTQALLGGGASRPS